MLQSLAVLLVILNFKKMSITGDVKSNWLLKISLYMTLYVFGPLARV
jgi:hypothetical protein